AAIDGLLARQGRVGDEGELLAAELVAGCLRLQPDAERARAALAALVDAGQRLPIGLLGRCGLALLAAGDDARAERCLQSMSRGGEFATAASAAAEDQAQLVVQVL